MRKRIVSLTLVLIALIWCTLAGPAIFLSELPSGQPLDQRPDWPQGMADLLTRAGPVYGCSEGWFGGNYDCFYFSGDTDDFNSFVGHYAKLKGASRVLSLHPGRAEARRITDERPVGPFDWKVSVITHSKESGGSLYIGLELWAGGQVRLSELRVPASMEVSAAGEVDLNELRVPLKIELIAPGRGEELGEIEKFIARHNEKRKKAAQTEEGLETSAQERAEEKAARVSGIVTDEAGKPLSGVTWWISGFEEWRDGNWQIVFRTGDTLKHTTDETGRFEVTFREKVAYDLQFDRWEYAPAFLFRVSPYDPFRLLLSRARSAAGTGADSPELHVVMKKGVLVTGEVQIEGKDRPDFEGITVALRLPNGRGLWFKKTTLVDHEGKFRFYAGPPPTPPGAYCKWQLVCAGEVVTLDVREDRPVDEVIFQISTTSETKSSTAKRAMIERSQEGP